MSVTPQLRVMTCDARSLRGDAEALAAVVQAHSPDVLLVQRAPRFLRWRSKRAALARRCGLVVATTDRPGGLCILTSLRVDLVSTSFALLAKPARRPQQAVASATVSLSGTHWQVATAQLDADAARRQDQLTALWASLAVDGAPLVLGGDLDAGPADGRLDVILADPAVTVVSRQVVDDPGVGRAGRHRPVVAVLSS